MTERAFLAYRKDVLSYNPDSEFKRATLTAIASRLAAIEREENTQHYWRSVHDTDHVSDRVAVNANDD